VARLDYLKERIGYLKLWQSIVIAVDVSLLGWLVANAQGPDNAQGAHLLLLILAGVLIALVGAVAVFLHSKIAGCIDEIERT
jgi:hypothetical protein